MSGHLPPWTPNQPASIQEGHRNASPHEGQHSPAKRHRPSSQSLQEDHHERRHQFTEELVHGMGENDQSRSHCERRRDHNLVRLDPSRCCAPPTDHLQPWYEPRGKSGRGRHSDSNRFSSCRKRRAFCYSLLPLSLCPGPEHREAERTSL